MVASFVEELGAFAGGRAFRHRGRDAKKAMLSRSSWRSSNAIGNGMGSIEFWWLRTRRQEKDGSFDTGS